IDRTLVSIEDALDLLAAPRGTLAAACGRDFFAAPTPARRDRALDLCRRAAREPSAAGIAAQRRGIDAAAAAAGAGRDQRPLRDGGAGFRGRGRARRDLRRFEAAERVVIAKRGQLLGERQDAGDARTLAGLEGPVDGRRRRRLDRGGLGRHGALLDDAL